MTGLNFFFLTLISWYHELPLVEILLEHASREKAKEGLLL
jgi:hypothetical protein